MSDLSLEMNERQWTTIVRRYARQGGWRAYHTRYSVGSDPGFPDFILIRKTPEGRSIGLAVELKNEKNRLTETQKEWLGMFHGASFEADVWRPDDVELVYKTLVTREFTWCPKLTGRFEWKK